MDHQDIGLSPAVCEASDEVSACSAVNPPAPSHSVAQQSMTSSNLGAN